MHPFAALALIFLLTACIPAPYGPYYKPSYPDQSAMLVKQYCGGHAGPPSVLKFTVADKVGFRVSTSKTDKPDTDDEISMSVRLDIPSNTQMEFLSDQVIVSDSVTDKGRLVKAEFLVSGTRGLEKTDVVDISQYSPLPTSVLQALLRKNPEQTASETHLDFLLGDNQFHPQTMTLNLPEISIQNETIALPALTLIANTQDKGWWRYETTAHQQSRQQRYQRCVEQTPHQACNNILEVLDEGFKENVADFEINGRLYIADFMAEPRLRGRLNLLSRNLAPWQFKTPVISAKDNDTGETQSYEIEHFSVVFGEYTVPLDTPVRGVEANSKGSTTAEITVNLGASSQHRFFVQLPPIRINGQVHELQPVELELRLFDGGIEPFNC